MPMILSFQTAQDNVNIDLNKVVCLARGPDGNTIFRRSVSPTDVHTLVRWEDLMERLYEGVQGVRRWPASNSAPRNPFEHDPNGVLPDE